VQTIDSKVDNWKKKEVDKKKGERYFSISFNISMEIEM
jgi:hypothetical protein